MKLITLSTLLLTANTHTMSSPPTLLDEFKARLDGIGPRRQCERIAAQLPAGCTHTLLTRNLTLKEHCYLPLALGVFCKNPHLSASQREQLLIKIIDHAIDYTKVSQSTADVLCHFLITLREIIKLHQSNQTKDPATRSQLPYHREWYLGYALAKAESTQQHSIVTLLQRYNADESKSVYEKGGSIISPVSDSKISKVSFSLPEH